jgi:hypothetical protein
MLRVTLALLAAAMASACQSYSSGKASSDLVLIALKTADDTASTDCDPPRTSFHPTGQPATRQVSLGTRLTAVALVHRRQAPRRPHSVIGTVRSSVAEDSLCLTDLTREIQGRAVVEGCDAIVVGDEVSTEDERTLLEGSCLVFTR